MVIASWLIASWPMAKRGLAWPQDPVESRAQAGLGGAARAPGPGQSPLAMSHEP